MSEQRLSKLIDAEDLTKTTQMQDRCIRALVLKPEIRSLISQWRVAFPALTFTAIRALSDDDVR